MGFRVMNDSKSVGFEVLVGRDAAHLVESWSGHLLHFKALISLEKLRDEASAAGFDLAVASSYRSYDRQLLIWQDKVAGKRVVLDCNETAVDVERMSQEQLLWLILRWSALPGTSRHHWGTDIDVFDAGAFTGNETLQLTVRECCEGGPLFDFHCWLDQVLASDKNYGFYRPYAKDSIGVAEEPWHISYAPVADELESQFTFAVFMRLLNENKWPLCDAIERHAQTIFQRYIQANKRV
jgi:LAS superfamily LD-carboxypeptidase LdcB